MVAGRERRRRRLENLRAAKMDMVLKLKRLRADIEFIDKTMAEIMEGLDEGVYRSYYGGGTPVPADLRGSR